MFNRRVLIEYDAVVILDARVFLISHFNLTVRKGVYLVFKQEIVVVVRLVIEKCCLDLGADSVNQFDIEQTAIAPLIFPCLFLMFLCYASFNFPIE